MPDTLQIFYPASRQQPRNWSWAGIVTGCGDDQQLQAVVEQLDDNTTIILLLPGEEVLLSSANIPAKQNLQIKKAAPFAIEELLASDPARLQVSSSRDHGADKQPGLVHIAAVNKDYLQQCLQQLENLRINPDMVFADSMSLPLPDPGQLLVQAHLDGRVMLRWGKNQGRTIATGLLASWLPMLLAENPELNNISLDSDAEKDQSLVQHLTEVSGLELNTGQFTTATAQDYKQAVNILSGDFRPARYTINTTSWRWPIRLLAAALVLLLVNAFILQKNDRQRLQQLDENIEGLFRATFPSVQRIEDPLIQARQQLATRAGGSSGHNSLTTLLHEFSAALKQYPELKLQALDYRAGKLEIQLQAKNIEVLENLREAIRQQGANAKLSSANLGQQGVDARLLISRGDG